MNFAVRITTASRTTGDVTARMTVETTPMRSIAVSRSHLSEHNKAFSTLMFVLNCFNCQETLCGIFRGQFHRLFEDFLLSVCLFTICLFGSYLAHIATKKDQLFKCFMPCYYFIYFFYLCFKPICSFHTTTVYSYHGLSNFKKDKNSLCNLTAHGN